MKTLPDRQLKCFISEPSGIIAAELEDELRFAFDAEIFRLSSGKIAERFDIAILDCPASVTAFLNLIDDVRHRTRAFVFTHTNDIPFETLLTNINFRSLEKPYSMVAIVGLVSQLIDEIDFNIQV